VGEHHERLDGSGYPNRLSGGQSSILAQMTGLVDAYDDLAGNPSGRTSISPSQAVQQLYKFGLGLQHDPVLVEQLIQCLGIFPVGSFVELTTGERAIVYSVNQRDRLKPVVKLVTDTSQSWYETPPIVDLSMPDATVPARAIARVLDPRVDKVDVASYCTV
jgi:HD domain